MVAPSVRTQKMIAEFEQQIPCQTLNSKSAQKRRQKFRMIIFYAYSE
jgi:hypothetical protein